MSRSSSRRIESRDAFLEHVHAMLADATHEVFLSLPEVLLPEVTDDLAAARDRGAMVSLLVYGSTDSLPDEYDLDDVGSLVRVCERVKRSIVFIAVDGVEGVFTTHPLAVHDDPEAWAFATADPLAEHLLFAGFTFHSWPMGTEVHTTDPVPLPHEFDRFKPAVVHATLHLQNETPVVATVDARSTEAPYERDTVRGEVVTTRQGVVFPTTNSFMGETTLILTPEGGDQRVTFGGEDAYVEDYEALGLTLGTTT